MLSNSRGPESLAGVVEELGAGATAGTVAEAGDADLVLLAVPWSADLVHEAGRRAPLRAAPAQTELSATSIATAASGLTTRNVSDSSR